MDANSAVTITVSALAIGVALAVLIEISKSTLVAAWAGVSRALTVRPDSGKLDGFWIARFPAGFGNETSAEVIEIAHMRVRRQRVRFVYQSYRIEGDQLQFRVGGHVGYGLLRGDTIVGPFGRMGGPSKIAGCYLLVADSFSDSQDVSLTGYVVQRTVPAQKDQTRSEFFYNPVSFVRLNGEIGFWSSIVFPRRQLFGSMPELTSFVQQEHVKGALDKSLEVRDSQAHMRATRKSGPSR